MLQKTSSAPAAAPPARRRAASSASLAELDAQLRALGLRPRLMVAGNGVMAGGVALQLTLDHGEESRVETAAVLGRLRRTLLQRIPATLALAPGWAEGDSAAFERVLERLAAVLASPCIDKSRLGIAVDARDLSLAAFDRLVRVLLGRGPRYLFVDESMPDADAAWSGLWSRRNRGPQVVPVYGGGARTHCPLLADEATGTLLPQRSLLVPPDTAWLPLDLYLHRYADARGAIREAELKLALTRGLSIADELFDRLAWPERVLANDAFLNRRVAVTVHGIGDLVALRGEDPGDVNCLARWDRLLSSMHRWLWNRSRELATERGLLPALECRNPAREYADGRHRRDWQRRWQQALETDAVRHRNLLALSPYGVLPRCGAGLAGYAELLPLLAHADVASFAGAGAFANWTPNEFKHFHRQARAAIERRNAASFIAAGA